MRNFFPAGSQVEIIQPRNRMLKVDVDEIINEVDGLRWKQPMQIISAHKNASVKPLSMLRIAKLNSDSSVLHRASRPAGGQVDV